MFTNIDGYDTEMSICQHRIQSMQRWNFGDVRPGDAGPTPARPEIDQYHASGMLIEFKLTAIDVG